MLTGFWASKKDARNQFEPDRKSDCSRMIATVPRLKKHFGHDGPINFAGQLFSD